MEQTALSINHSDNVHYQATLLQAWDQEYTQLHPGGFEGSVTSLQTGDVRLFSEQMNRAVYQMGGLPTHKIAFGMPTRAQGHCFICGEAATQSNLLVFSGQEGFEFLSPDDFEFYGIEIDCKSSADPVFLALVRALRKTFESGRRAIWVDPDAARAAANSLASVFAAGARRDAALSDPERERAFNRQLVGAVLDMLKASACTSEKTVRHWDTIANIRSLVCERPYCPLSVAELTVELGVSRRTLQNACQEILGMSPVQYLRALRLSEARRMIENSSSVTEVATQYGFWHLGYFARDYHAMFGELPSKTLERYKRC